MVHEHLYHPRFSSILTLHEIDSTNNYASKLIAEGMAVHGHAVFAHIQTAGKGQRGKDWHSQKNESILMSTIIKPTAFKVQDQFLLIAITALAVRKVFDKYANSDTQIKWPNDIYCLGRKAAGILIENNFTGHQWNWAVIGTGININQKEFNTSVNRAVSLKQITGKEWDTLVLADEIREEIVKSIDHYSSGSANSIMDEYNRWLFKKNEIVTFNKEDEQFSATVLKATRMGELVVSGITEEKLQFGEVSWVL
ncbi:MAG: biotin--[acetyl-CoA-carboxylase] ligase [Chitinophagaceae bacterium]|nr:MAG: biotin--[acetyl-CoA-carboxylase] ligase [Chitinophagaceae bacterium]